MKALSKSNKLKSFVAPKMTDLTTYLDNNEIFLFIQGGSIHGLYPYIEMIVDPTAWTTSVWCSRHFGTSFSINTDAATLQPIIAALCMR